MFATLGINLIDKIINISITFCSSVSHWNFIVNYFYKTNDNLALI